MNNCMSSRAKASSPGFLPRALGRRKGPPSSLLGAHGGGGGRVRQECSLYLPGTWGHTSTSSMPSRLFSEYIFESKMVCSSGEFPNTKLKTEKTHDTYHVNTSKYV